MEFHQKIQELRRQKGITQEELAEKLYVSRTAISKWESGRGYPNIDSLKAIATYFSVSVDELLSGNELLTLAEADHKEKAQRTGDLIFGLLDCSAAMLLFLPFFGEKTGNIVKEVSLLGLSGPRLYLRIGYYLIVIGMVVWGGLLLTLRSWQAPAWLRAKQKLSLLLNVAGALLFVLSLQPYPAVLLFVFLAIKIILKTKIQK